MKWDILGTAIVSTDGPLKYLIAEQYTVPTRPSRWQAWRLATPGSINIGTFRTAPLAQAACDDDCRRQLGLFPYMTPAAASGLSTTVVEVST